jgi:hypothetical protein
VDVTFYLKINSGALLGEPSHPFDDRKHPLEPRFPERINTSKDCLASSPMLQATSNMERNEKFPICANLLVDLERLVVEKAKAKWN